MPYFVYKVIPGPANLIKNLEQLDDFEKFKLAKNFAKTYRVEQDIKPDGDVEVKIIFAETRWKRRRSYLRNERSPF